jgi:predicted RNA binding protein YcfA (HicA-like mRNA interferase family)
MVRIRTLRPAALVRVLEKAGYIRARQTGSHVIMTKPGRRSIPVPFHTNTLKRGLQEAIVKQAELTSDDVLSLLSQ